MVAELKKNRVDKKAALDRIGSKLNRAKSLIKAGYTSGKGKVSGVAGKVKGSGRGGKGASARDTGRPRFAPGTSASDIADYYANDLD